MAAYIDQKMQQISRSGAAYNDAHLTVLTSLLLADELFDLRDAAAARPAKNIAPPAVNNKEESAIVGVLEHLTDRIESLSRRIQNV